ncbi:hypothetical protein RhiJN_22412 [Ceratobasidium sp. AG-Ba]|nr:hypothetical protein RhiJN_22412 [Ceratobasidium sp. AG-Ba]
MLWVYLCRKLWGSTHPEDNIPGTHCQEEEKRVSEKDSPDAVTARALDWLIRHADEESAVDAAIRAIAGANLPKDVWDILAKDSLIALVAQKFTALFGGVLDSEDSTTILTAGPSHGIDSDRRQPSDSNGVSHQDQASVSGLASEPAESSRIIPVYKAGRPDTLQPAASGSQIEPTLTARPKLGAYATLDSGQSSAEHELEIVKSLYGRALTNIAKHCSIITATSGSNNDLEAGSSAVASIPLTSDQTKAVTRGLHLLVLSQSPDISALGLTSISAWHMFTMESRDKWQATLERSFDILIDHVRGKTPVQADAVAGLMQVLPIEISYWQQDLSKQQKKKLLHKLVDLISEKDLPVQVKDGLPLVLAVLAIAINDYPSLYTRDDFCQWEDAYGEYKKLIEAHHEAAKKWMHGPSEDISSIPTTNSHANRAGWRAWRAQQAARIYTDYPKLCKDHTDPLLLLGLAGLLGSLGSLGLEDCSTDISKAIAKMLRSTSSLNKSEQLTLPLVLPLSFDIRSYVVDRIIYVLLPPRFRNDVDTLDEEAKVYLLETFVETPRIWVDFGPQLALPVIQLLHATENDKLCKQCIIALDNYTRTKPSLHEWEPFVSYAIPEKMVSVVKKNADVRFWVAQIFEFFSHYLGEPSESRTSKIFDILRLMISKDLFGTLIYIIRGSGSKYLVDIWQSPMLELPRVLKSNSHHDQGDAELLKKMDEFCGAYVFDTETKVNRFVGLLKNELGKVNDSSTHEVGSSNDAER